MGWPRETDDEVRVFHPAFSELASLALDQLGLKDKYEWQHHPGVAASTTVIPDFVLVEKETSRWITVVEIKRTIADVASTRYQLQAKGYAENYAYLYYN